VDAPFLRKKSVPREMECVPFISESVPIKVRTLSNMKGTHSTFLGTLCFLKKKAFTFLERVRMSHIFHWECIAEYYMRGGYE